MDTIINGGVVIVEVDDIRVGDELCPSITLLDD
jgi:hypothetical protein